MTAVTEKLRPGPRYNPWVTYRARMALFDIDGTLVPHNSPELPSQRFIAAAHAAGERALVGLATARPLQKAAHIIDKARMRAPSVLSNGAQIYDGRTGRVVVERCLPADVVTNVTRILQRANITHWVQDDGVDYRWTGLLGLAQRARGGLGEYVRPKGNIWRPATGDNAVVEGAYEPRKPFVLVAHDVRTDQVNPLLVLGGSYADRNVTSFVAHQNDAREGTPATYDIFFVDKRANKRTGLEVAADLSGIPVEEVAATGDGPNDTVIVEYAGIGVAMGNGVPATLEVATFVAPPLAQEGATCALEQLVVNR